MRATSCVYYILRVSNVVRENVADKKVLAEAQTVASDARASAPRVHLRHLEDSLSTPPPREDETCSERHPRGPRAALDPPAAQEERERRSAPAKLLSPRKRCRGAQLA